MLIQLSRLNKLSHDKKWVGHYPDIPRRYLSTCKIVNYYYSQYNWLNVRERIHLTPYCKPDLDGYKKYRQKGSLERVLNNIHMVQTAKKKLYSDNRQIVWSYFVFNYNQKLNEEARRTAYRHGMEFQTTWGTADGTNWLIADIHFHPVDDVSRHPPTCSKYRKLRRYFKNIEYLFTSISQPVICMEYIVYTFHKENPDHD